MSVFDVFGFGEYVMLFLYVIVMVLISFFFGLLYYYLYCYEESCIVDLIVCYLG